MQQLYLVHDKGQREPNGPEIQKYHEFVEQDNLKSV